MKFPDRYEEADQSHNGKFKSVSSFKNDTPTGVTVHYTADRDLERTVRALVARELGYHLLIDRQGKVFQCAPLTKTLWHAGKALWGPFSPNKAHIGVSLISWGEVEKTSTGTFESWNGQILGDWEVVNRCGDRWWDAATPVQEKSLIDVLAWLCEKGIDVSQICGHDECAIPHGRKSDPGGVITMSMEELRSAVVRQLIKKEPIS